MFITSVHFHFQLIHLQLNLFCLGNKRP